MKVLQICNKPPFPPVDGGCIAMNNITEGLIENGAKVKVLSISTKKHPVMDALLPEPYLQKTNFEHVFINTEIKLKDAFLNLFSGESYNINRFISSKFKRKLIEVIESESFDIILLDSLYVTPYIDVIQKHCTGKVILRAHNVEHLIWERIAKNTINPIKKQYVKLLTKKLYQYEKDILNKLDGVVAITDLDRNTFINLGFTKKILTIPVGYNFKQMPTNEEVEKGSFFHIASMDWMPNQEAVTWFLENVWSEIIKLHPTQKLYLAGRNMPKWLLNNQTDNVEVVGEVANAKSFMLSKDIMVVPLLSGSGMRVKIIEGMALGKTIITTSIGAEGISFEPNKHLLIADSTKEFIAQIDKCLNDEAFKNKIGLNAQRKVAEEYDNIKICLPLINYFDEIINIKETAI